MLIVLFIFFFFFFQAEDGIRDLTVTGVQTCALPIWMTLPGLDRRDQRGRAASRRGSRSPVGASLFLPSLSINLLLCRPADRATISRSEERRVGKECSSVWWGGDCKEI